MKQTFSSPYVQLFCRREPLEESVRQHYRGLNYYLYYLGFLIIFIIYPKTLFGGSLLYIYSIIYPKTLFELLRPLYYGIHKAPNPLGLHRQVLPPVEPMLAQMMLNAKCWCAPLRTARSDRFLFGSAWPVPFRSRS